MTDRQHDPQHDPTDEKQVTEQQKTQAPPRDLRHQEPKDSPVPKGAQVPEVNPPSVQPGHRDREQV